MLYCYMLSPVRPSVRHTGGSVEDGEDRIMQLSPQSSPMALVSSWLTSPRNSKGNIGSGGAEWQRGRKNTQLLANKWPYLRNGNRKWHMRFRLVPKSSTLDDLELLQVQIFSEFSASSHVCEATTAKRMKVDQHFQWQNRLRTESTFEQCIHDVDIA